MCLRALQIAALNQERLDDILDGVARLRQRRRHGLNADRAAAVIHRDGGEITPVHGVKASGINLERAQRVVGNGAIDRSGIRRGCKIADPPQQPPGNARRAAGAARDFVGAIRRHADLEHAGAAGDDLFQLFHGIEIQPHRNAEAVAQRIGQQPRARGGADQREFCQLDLDRARCRSLADNQIELEILHRRIQHFLDRGAEAMDFVDEQNITLFEIGEKCRKIAGLGDDRPGGGAKADTKFARHDLRQRGLAEAGGADEQHMVQRLAAFTGRLDEDRKIGARLRLADEFGQQLRAQRGVADIVGAALRRDDAGGRGHAAILARGARLSSPLRGRDEQGGGSRDARNALHVSKIEKSLVFTSPVPSAPA